MIAHVLTITAFWAVLALAVSAIIITMKEN
jgi:hypothetical protein